jgi:phage shock protein PspC (stress-responsive transcriptional regulator)
MSKRLYKSNHRILCGVCGGIGEYFNIDPTLVRLIWAAMVVFAGTGILIYIIFACIMPNYPAPNISEPYEPYEPPNPNSN